MLAGKVQVAVAGGLVAGDRRPLAGPIAGVRAQGEGLGRPVHATDQAGPGGTEAGEHAVGQCRAASGLIVGAAVPHLAASTPTEEEGEHRRVGGPLPAAFPGGLEGEVGRDVTRKALIAPDTRLHAEHQLAVGAVAEFPDGAPLVHR